MNLKETVELFLKESSTKTFVDLLSLVEKKYNVVDSQMFKEWTQKEFPGQLVYVSLDEATELLMSNLSQIFVDGTLSIGNDRNKTIYIYLHKKNVAGKFIPREFHGYTVNSTYVGQVKPA